MVSLFIDFFIKILYNIYIIKKESEGLIKNE